MRKIDIRPEVPSRIELSREREFEESAMFIAELEFALAARERYDQFELVGIPYIANAKKFFTADGRTHGVVVISLKQPRGGPAMLGKLERESYVIMGKRGQDRWGAGSWAMPMGKIEPADFADTSCTVGDAIRRAALREMGEEVVRGRAEGFFVVANSYLDRGTNTVIHVVIEEVGRSHEGKEGIAVALPDAREHRKLGWVRMADVPRLTPMAKGAKFSLLAALAFLKDRNADSIRSKRFT